MTNLSTISWRAFSDQTTQCAYPSMKNHTVMGTPKEKNTGVEVGFRWFKL